MRSRGNLCIKQGDSQERESNGQRKRSEKATLKNEGRKDRRVDNE